MAKLIPFAPGHRKRDAAAYLLALSVRWQRSSKSRPWLQPAHPEDLGNLLQQLTASHPGIVFVIGNLVAEMVAQLEK